MDVPFFLPCVCVCLFVCLFIEEGMDRLKLWLMENPTHTNETLLEELRSIQTFASLRPADRAIIYLGMEMIYRDCLYQSILLINLMRQSNVPS
jgi:hypothetical protein